MAAIKLGLGITLMAGKLGGHVFARGRFIDVWYQPRYSYPLHHLLDGRVWRAFATARKRAADLSDSEAAAFGGLSARLPQTDWNGTTKRLPVANYVTQKDANLILDGIDTPLDPFTFDNLLPLFRPSYALWSYGANQLRLMWPDANTLSNMRLSVWAGPELVQEVHTLDYTYIGIYVDDATSRGPFSTLLKSMYPNFNNTWLMFFRWEYTTPSGNSVPPLFLRTQLHEVP